MYYLFGRYSLLKEFLHQEAGGKTGYHAEEICFRIGGAYHLGEQILHNIHRLELVPDPGYSPAHLLLVDIILMFQLADPSLHLTYIPDLHTFYLLQIFRISK